MKAKITNFDVNWLKGEYGRFEYRKNIWRY